MRKQPCDTITHEACLVDYSSLPLQERKPVFRQADYASHAHLTGLTKSLRNENCMCHLKVETRDKGMFQYCTYKSPS